jgi:hypothetical protein
MALEWRVSSFERGFTDNYVNGARNTGQVYDNLIITRNRKLRSRPGSLIYDNSTIDVQQIPPGNQRIQHLKYHEGVLYEFSADEIFYRSSGVFNELVGPVDSNDAFGDVGTTSSRNSSSQWQSHLLTSIDEYVIPRKIYTDQDGVVQLRTMGLPSPGDVRGIQTAFALANALKATYNTHVTDTSPAGSDHDITDTTVTAPDATDLDSLVTLTNQIKDLYIAHNDDADVNGPVHIGAATSPVDDRQLDTKDDVVTLSGVISMLNDIKEKYNNHDADGGAHTNSPVTPETTDDATKDFTITSAAGPHNHLYGLAYKYQYTVGNVTYIDRSPIHVLFAGSITAGAVTVEDIPVLSNNTFGTSESWDTDNIKVEIYRTEDAGFILKSAWEVSNGTTTKNDDKPDEDLGINAYTTGGQLDNDLPPPCKYLTVANDVAWYANVKEGSEENSFRVRHSIPFDPDACPQSFFIDVDEPITGISSIGIFPVVFTADKTYRLEGQVDATGRGFVRKRIIDDTVGCISNNGIVQVKDGLYFPAKDGFYFTNGLKLTKVTNHLNLSYEALADSSNANKIYGVHEPISERVFWAVTDSTTASENNRVWVLDTHWGRPNGEATFTTWSYGNNGFPTALEVIQGDLIRADNRGYTFRHTDDADNVDPVVDTGENPEDWTTKQVIWDYVSSAFTFGSEFQRKWVTRLLTTIKSLTNTSIQPFSINDDSGAQKVIKEIRTRSVFEWGDPQFEWGDPDFVWNAPATTNAIRRFPRKGLRCTYKQVQYTNSETIIYSSIDLGLITIDATALTATLISGNFPSTDLIGFELKLTNGDQFTIVGASSNVLTLEDPQTLLEDSNQDNWSIVGFRKDEQLNLEAYTVLYDFFGESNTAYRTGDDGG